MLAGSMRHGDNQGNTGYLKAGSVQWMTAGRGIVRSEMPRQEDGLMWGFRLWVNLPPGTDDRAALPGHRAGKRAGDRPPPVRAPARDRRQCRRHGRSVQGHRHRAAASTCAWTPARAYRAQLPTEHNAFAYVCEGSARAG